MPGGHSSSLPTVPWLLSCVWSCRNGSGHRDLLSGHSCTRGHPGENQGQRHSRHRRASLGILCRTALREHAHTLRPSKSTPGRVPIEMRAHAHRERRAQSHSEQSELKTTAWPECKPLEWGPDSQHRTKQLLLHTPPKMNLDAVK